MDHNSLILKEFCNNHPLPSVEVTARLITTSKYSLVSSFWRHSDIVISGLSNSCWGFAVQQYILDATSIRKGESNHRPIQSIIWSGTYNPRLDRGDTF